MLYKRPRHMLYDKGKVSWNNIKDNVIIRIQTKKLQCSRWFTSITIMQIIKL